MIGSGHIFEYMKQWGNLTNYSQQGWEALNALIKLCFSQRTSKDGHRSSKSVTEGKSKLLPIAKLIQSFMFWICNLFPDTGWNKTADNEQQSEETIVNDGDDNVHNIILSLV